MKTLNGAMEAKPPSSGQPTKPKKSRRTRDQIKLDLMIRVARGDLRAIMEYLTRYGKQRGYGAGNTRKNDEEFF
jgi:hypothetical protein